AYPPAGALQGCARLGVEHQQADHRDRALVGGDLVKLRIRLVSAALVALASTTAAAAGGGGGLVSASGVVGRLRIDRSAPAAVEAFAGPPAFARTGGPIRPSPGTRLSATAARDRPRPAGATRCWPAHAPHPPRTSTARPSSASTSGRESSRRSTPPQPASRLQQGRA